MRIVIPTSSIQIINEHKTVEIEIPDNSSEITLIIGEEKILISRLDFIRVARALGMEK